MNDKYINRNEAHWRIHDLFAAEKEPVDSIPAFKRWVEKFEVNLLAIRQKDSGKVELTEGKTDVKTEACNDLIVHVIDVADAVNNYAAENSQVDLEVKSDLHEGTLTVLRDTELDKRSEAILGLTAGVEAGLVEHGLSAEELTEAKGTLDTFRKAISNRSLGEELSVAATKSIAQLMHENSSIVLNRFRRYIRKLEGKYPEFCARYYAAKRIVNKGGGHKGNTGGDDSTPPPDNPA